jgi:plastocyanin domain-containing protein
MGNLWEKTTLQRLFVFSKEKEIAEYGKIVSTSQQRGLIKDNLFDLII